MLDNTSVISNQFFHNDFTKRRPSLVLSRKLQKRKSVFNNNILANLTAITIYTYNENQHFIFAAKLKHASFHSCIGIIIIIGQIFCLFPITGVLYKDVNRVKFKVFSIQTIFSIVYIVFALGEVTLSFHRMLLYKNIRSTGTAIFYLNGFCGAIFFIGLATKWQSLIKSWSRLEDCLLREPYEICGWKLKTKIYCMAFIILMMASIEYSLLQYSSYYYADKQATLCNVIHAPITEYFFVKENAHIFTVIPFSYYFVPIQVWLNISMTFCWNYVDIFIIVVSIGLATRFNQINDRLIANYRKHVPESYWTEIRQHYTRLIELTQAVDKDLSMIILLSCLSNLYFICFQLFNSFTRIPYFINNFYFWFSLLYLIGRTLSVLFFAASIHDASRRPLIILRDIPSKFWNVEIQRFIDLVADECVALSGKRFFFLTRKLILAMAGTIVTYELVLLDEVEQDGEKKSLCNLTRLNYTKL